MDERRQAQADEPQAELHLRLTRSELGSLLMAQIAQVRHSRATMGEHHPVAQLDQAVLEKLVAAQRRAEAGEAG